MRAPEASLQDHPPKLERHVAAQVLVALFTSLRSGQSPLRLATTVSRVAGAAFKKRAHRKEDELVEARETLLVVGLG